MIRPHKAPDSSCISRKLFNSEKCVWQLSRTAARWPGQKRKKLREKKMSVQIFRHRPPFFSFIKRWKRAITTLLPPYSQPNSHISWIGMLLRRERVEETIGTVNAGELNQFLRLSDFSCRYIVCIDEILAVIVG